MNINCFNNTNNNENVLALDISNLTFEKNQLFFNPIETMVEKKLFYAIGLNLEQKNYLAISNIMDDYFPIYIYIQSEVISGKSYKNPDYYGKNYILCNVKKLNTKDRSLSLNAESKVVLWIHFKKIF